MTRKLSPLTAIRESSWAATKTQQSPPPPKKSSESELAESESPRTESNDYDLENDIN